MGSRPRCEIRVTAFGWAKAARTAGGVVCWARGRRARLGAQAGVVALLHAKIPRYSAVIRSMISEACANVRRSSGDNPASRSSSHASRAEMVAWM